MDSILEVNGLVKRYPAFFLDNISFSLPEGCVLGFIGANGAGKTTTIRSILNLAHKDAGTIKIFGLDTVKHEQEIKDRIGIVMDGSYFYSDSRNDLPLLEVVANPVAVDPDDVLRATAQERGWPVLSLRD